MPVKMPKRSAIIREEKKYSECETALRAWLKTLPVMYEVRTMTQMAWDNAWKARGVADVEAVEAARKSVDQDGLEMIPSVLCNEIEDRIKALDEGGGDE